MSFYGRAGLFLRRAIAAFGLGRDEPSSNVTVEGACFRTTVVVRAALATRVHTGAAFATRVGFVRFQTRVFRCED